MPASNATNNFVSPVRLDGTVNVVIQALSKWLQAKLKMRPSYLGTAPGHLLFQTGQVFTTFNAGADATLVFPQPFPTACIGVVATSANVAQLIISTNGFTASAVNLRGSAASISVMVGYIAIGY